MQATVQMVLHLTNGCLCEDKALLKQPRRTANCVRTAISELITFIYIYFDGVIDTKKGQTSHGVQPVYN